MSWGCRASPSYLYKYNDLACLYSKEPGHRRPCHFSLAWVSNSPFLKPSPRPYPLASNHPIIPLHATVMPLLYAFYAPIPKQHPDFVSSCQVPIIPNYLTHPFEELTTARPPRLNPFYPSLHSWPRSPHPIPSARILQEPGSCLAH